MNELIPTQETNEGQIIVSGRDLHEFLEVGTRYDKWFGRMKEYGFTENEDFIAVVQKRPTAQGNETTFTDHHIRLDMAKEISMLQRNERGKMARQYFIEIERRWNSPEMVMKRAMDYLNAQVQKLTTQNLVLEQQVKEFQPKASYYDLILQNKSVISVSQIAKDYGMGAPTLNRKLKDLGVQYKQGGVWLLYAKYQDKGYTSTKTHAIDSEKSKLHTYWTQKGRLFIYDLLKSQGILPVIEREQIS